MHTCRSKFMLGIVFVIFYMIWNLPEVELFKCAGLDSPLAIFPKGDHIIENGSVLELFCKLDVNHPKSLGYDARDLSFYTNEGENKVTLPNVTIVNETTVKIDLVSPPVGFKYYYCAVNHTSDCLTGVTVGYKPLPVLNFQCTSFNWERLHCSWTPPENPIETVYRLMYTLPGRAGGSPRACPNQSDIKSNNCIYDSETEPIYRKPYEYYCFEIIGENALGNFSESITFHHYARVIPNQPENLTVINKTIGSAVIGWNIPLSLHHFPPGLRFKIEYKNKWEDWVVVNTTKFEKLHLCKENCTYNITGLKYSHTPYDVRVYLKSGSNGSNGSSGWSQPASTTFVTASSIPSMAPATTQGCFDVVSSGNDTDVFIYWARISEKFENGDNFTYNVICTMENGEDCGAPIEKSMSYAKFPYSSRHSYNFTIYSANEVGRSQDNSYVFIPKFRSLIAPERFTKVAYDYGLYELSWKPVHDKNLSNYTIFWCKEDKELPVPCKGYINWVTVQKETTSKNITMNDTHFDSFSKFYKFAIAANLADGTSSGMVWSSCVIFHDKVLKKVDDFNIVGVRPREVDVVWEIRCAQSSAFKGFAFYYCPVGASPEDNNCRGNMTEEVTKLYGSQERNITLTNLKPYTTYKLQIAIISLDGSHQIQMGPRSISKEFTTSEDVPGVPLYLSATSVTNSSIILTWVLPEELNGVLRTYELNLAYPGGEKIIKFDAQNASDKSIIVRYEAQDLISFTTYNVSLKACTGKCSDYSEPLIVTTLIGVPGKMMRPQVSIVNTTVADVSWEAPVPSAGPLNFYQLLVTVDGESIFNEIFNITGSRAKLPIKACDVKYKVPEFRLRAINIDDNNTTYYGPWSEATEVHCGSSIRAENAVLIDWISGTFTLLIVSACVFYIAKKGWLQCRKMKDVEVKLPPGLQPQDLEKDNQDCVHLDRWLPRSPETGTGSVGTVVAPDEESLLDKKSDESIDNTSFNMPIKNGGDSSGCSVGRESVSSSITSDTHISSDSGAEPDQRKVKSTGFEPWGSSSRRNGNCNNLQTDSTREAFNLSDLGEWDLSEPTIPGYTKVGLTNGYVSEKNLPSKGYVTIGSVTSISPPQKTNSESTGTTLTTNNFIRRTEVPRSLDSGSSNVNFSNKQSVATPKYVSLNQFEVQKIDDPNILVKMQNGARSPARESPKLLRVEESSELEEEKTEDSIDDFSGNETETETIHEVPVIRNLAAMPPYVSMTDNPGRTRGVDVETDGDDEDDIEGLSPNSNAVADLKTANGIDSVLVDKVNKERESFSNYIPHHVFEKESVHT